MTVAGQRCSPSGVEDGVWILQCAVAAISAVTDQLALLAADGHRRHVGAAQRRHARAGRARRKANAAQTIREAVDRVAAGKATATVFAARLLICADVAHENNRTRDVVKQVTGQVATRATSDRTQHAAHALGWKIITDYNEGGVNFFGYAADDLTRTTTS